MSHDHSCGCHHGQQHQHGQPAGLTFGADLRREEGLRDAPTGIVLAAFGAASASARAGLDEVCAAVRAAYPAAEVMMAYTSLKVRRSLRNKGLAAPCPAAALSELRDMGVSRAVVQPLHTVPGIEYEFVRGQALSFVHPRKGFLSVEVGAPLLFDDDDMAAAVSALGTYLPDDLRPDEAVLLVGHGTPHPAQARYMEFEALARRGHARLAVSLLTGRPGLPEAVAALRTFAAARVRVVPFMSVAGHHVHKDLAGEGEGSWATALRREGFAVSVSLTGTAAHPPFARIWLDHLERAMARSRGD